MVVRGARHHVCGDFPHLFAPAQCRCELRRQPSAPGPVAAAVSRYRLRRTDLAVRAAGCRCVAAPVARRPRGRGVTFCDQRVAQRPGPR